MLDLRPNLGPELLPVEVSWESWVAVALLVLVLLLLLLLVGWLFLLRLRRLGRPSPEEWALAELQCLATPPSVDRDALDRYYVHVSRVIRQYLDARFRLKSLEQTSSEFLGSLNGASFLTPEQRLQLASLLVQADLVKFARSCPSLHEAQALLAGVRLFIQQTGSVS